MSKEFELRDGRVNLIMEQVESAAPVPLISALFRPAKIKAAFLFNRSIEDSAWNYWHNLGRLEAEEKLGDRLETKSCIVPSRADCEEVINQLIKDGYAAIFATSPVMLNSAIEPALEHPDVRFLCCSLLSNYTNIRTYYIRFYEAKFLLGLAAGILSENGKIGYIADFPIYGAPAAANAFALGARMVNPQARIYLNWFSASWFNADNPFEDPEIRVICNRDITAPTHDARDYGLYGFNVPHIFRNGRMLYHAPPSLVKRLHDSGYWISIWFAYDAGTAEYYREAGADAFVTKCKAYTFPETFPDRKKQALLMRLLARTELTIKDAGSERRNESLYFCTWEPELAAEAILKTGEWPNDCKGVIDILENGK